MKKLDNISPTSIDKVRKPRKVKEIQEDLKTFTSDNVQNSPLLEDISYKGHTFRVNFEVMNIPRLQEIKNYAQGGYYMTNKDRYINDTWFAQLLELYYTSPLHGAILTNLHNLLIEGENDPVLNDITLDAIIYGGFAAEITWNYFHTKIVQIRSLPFEKIRAGLVDKDTHEIEYYMYSNDWFKTSYRKWTKLDTFNKSKNSSPHQIYYWKMARAGDIYPKPYYNAALKYVYVQNELATYFSSLIQNNFVSNGILHISNKMSKEQQDAMVNSFIDQGSGSRNAGGVTITSGQMDEVPQFVKFNQEQDDGKYMFLPDYTDFQIITGHMVPVQIMLPQPGKLGGTDEYEFFSKLYDKKVVRMKNRIMNGYNEIKKLM